MLFALYCNISKTLMTYIEINKVRLHNRFATQTTKIKFDRDIPMHKLRFLINAKCLSQDESKDVLLDRLTKNGFKFGQIYEIGGKDFYKDRHQLVHDESVFRKTLFRIETTGTAMPLTEEDRWILYEYCYDWDHEHYTFVHPDFGNLYNLIIKKKDSFCAIC